MSSSQMGICHHCQHKELSPVVGSVGAQPLSLLLGSAWHELHHPLHRQKLEQLGCNYVRLIVTLGHPQS